MQKNNNRATFERLRKEFPVLFYKGYSYSLDKNKISFSYEFKLTDDIIFKPAGCITVPELPQMWENIHYLVENIVFQIGLIELVSYWKATCSPKIEIECGSIDQIQAEWWKDLYFNGLGEFLYLNGIEISKDELVEINSAGKRFLSKTGLSLDDKYIVPIGGGKDSAVTLELLERSGKVVCPLIMNPRGATVDTVLTAGLNMKDVIIIERSIYPLLLELNERGFLNGHTPFSAMLAFYTLLASILTGYRHIALSNESSANEATIPGTGINHQYSKSLDFETKFRQYYTDYISPEFNYFSFLRPLNELQIVSIFSHLNKYHPIFKSCNVGSKENKWCGHCSKCLFTHIMLSAYKGVEYADMIIGQPMLEQPENIRYFDELSGISNIKPFECVGTLNDVQTALSMIFNNLKDKSLPLLIERFKTAKMNDISIETHNDLNNEHFLSEEQLQILKKTLYERVS